MPKGIKPRDVSKVRLIWDASGSRAPEDVAAAREVLMHLPESGKFELHVLRNTLEPVKHFKTRSELLAFIDTISYDGGTSYRQLTELAKANYKGTTLFFTDGIETFNGTVPEFGPNSIAVVSGKMRDIPTLQRICNGETIDLNILTADEAFREIVTPQPSVAKVIGKNISDVQVIGKASAGRVSVVGRLNAESDKVTVVLTDGRKFDVDLTTENIQTGKTLASAWAGSKVRELSPLAYTNKDELMTLGLRYNIVSPVTNRIVFESYEQWERYNIEPPKTLTEFHKKWEKNKQELERVETNDWNRYLKSEWQNKVEWWNDPIPQNLRDEYSCMPDENGNVDLTKCTYYRVSDGGIHIYKHFTPPEGWECTSDNNCSVTRRSYVNLGKCGCGVVAYDKRGSDSGSNNTLSFGGEEYEVVETEVTLRDWDPDTPYLKTLEDQLAQNASPDALYATYMQLRGSYSDSSAFYLHVADFFMKHKFHKYAARILSNLVELRVDDEGLLRVYAWRLRNGNIYDEAVDVARKITKLRPFDKMSWRDLALALEKRGKATKNPHDITEALEMYYKTAFDDPGDEDEWRSVSNALISIDEFNALASWSKRQTWRSIKPTIPKIDPVYDKLLDADLRVVITGDSNGTDVDLHVLEPTGEIISVPHYHSMIGGLLITDVTDGYGHEAYLLKSAPSGEYAIYTDYNASHQQNLIGASTVIATVYTNWGRPTQTEQTVIVRMDEATHFDSNNIVQYDYGDEDELMFISSIKVK